VLEQFSHFLIFEFSK